MPKTLAPYILQDGNRAQSDLADVAVNTPGSLAAFVNSGVTAAGTYTAPTPAAALTVPPQRFAVTNRTTADITLTFPNPAGTTITLTVMAGEVITFRQVTTSGYINESGNKPRAGLDARYLNQAVTVAQLPAGTQLTKTITASQVTTATRPTSRTDIPVYWFISDGNSGTARPTNAIAGDEVGWPA